MKILTFIVMASLFLGGCDKSEQTTVILEPSVITHGDECHLCGMIISTFPGPKGQAAVRHHNQTLKFCSTVDLFSWLLQPETPGILQIAYVHDMGAAPSWEEPSDKHYISAEEAWYVVGHKRKGAMGHTLASFRNKADAELFAGEYAGRLIQFDDINLDLMANLR